MDSQQANISSFVQDGYVRGSWIAFFTLWVLWGLSYFIRHAFGRTGYPTNTTNAATAEDPEAQAATAGTTGKKKFGSGIMNSSMADRLARSHEILFENTLLLLSVLVLNTLGVGSTRAVMILAWIFFAFTALDAFTEIGVNHHFIRMVFNLLFFAITLAIGGLAFHYGWHHTTSVF
ncbi:hypothetical protein CU098_004204 [Rhizopus stolonifer]|uniref:Uncharacterized protein n=1 Tax=Rhizopus stolonifer TaxID=4846 RepID=A0A367IL60_RHIST|nr:hypothetical protein CU098_004204 [Rhizopus stolonifer]